MLARVDTRPRHRNAGRPAEKSAPTFLKWLRGRPCILARSPEHQCSGKVRACHVDYAGDKGMSTKVSDRFAVPMCDGAHREQTDVLGWGPFEEKHKLDALKAADQFWTAWPGRGAWERARA
jgi:hypothetical protein